MPAGGATGTPLVSFILPTCNRADVVSQAISMCLLQTYRNVEVLVWDDGSTDETEAVVHRYSNVDKRVRYFKDTVNRGVGYARNRLLEKAKGKYIAFQDSDDLSTKIRIEFQVRAIEATGAPFVRTAYSWKGEQSVAFAKRAPYVVNLINHSVPTILFRKEAGAAFKENLMCGSDMVWELETVLKSGLGIYLPFELYVLRRHRRDRLSCRSHQDYWKKSWKRSNGVLVPLRESLRDQVRAKYGDRLVNLPPPALLGELYADVINRNWRKSANLIGTPQ